MLHRAEHAGLVRDPWQFGEARGAARQLRQQQHVPVIPLAQIGERRAIGRLRPAPDDEIEALGIDIPDELQLLHWHTAEASCARHQWNDGDRFAVGLDEQNMQFAPCAETFPPGAYPFVAHKGMTSLRFVDEPVPQRLEGEEHLVTRNRFDAPCEIVCGTHMGGRELDRLRADQTCDRRSARRRIVRNRVNPRFGRCWRTVFQSGEGRSSLGAPGCVLCCSEMRFKGTGEMPCCVRYAGHDAPSSESSLPTLPASVVHATLGQTP